MPKKKWKKPRKLSLVKFDFSKHDEYYNKLYKKVFKEDVYVFLGDMINMPDHCVVVGMKSGKIICGYHTDNFVELIDDEV